MLRLEESGGSCYPIAEISPKALGIATDFATLGGIVLGFKAIGDAVLSGGSIPWAVIGAFVAIVSALGIYSDLLDFLDDWKTAKVRRQGGGLMPSRPCSHAAAKISLPSPKSRRIDPQPGAGVVHHRSHSRHTKIARQSRLGC